MRWVKVMRGDTSARRIADRHYNRQNVGAAMFAPPGRALVLRTEAADALWITSWPFSEFVLHAWPGAWICSAFRNESPHLSSGLITEATRATRWRWPDVPDLDHPFVTFVDPSKVRRKRDPGRCFLRAGWERIGETAGGLIALGLPADRMPEAEAPLGAELELELELEVQL